MSTDVGSQTKVGKQPTTPTHLMHAHCTSTATVSLWVSKRDGRVSFISRSWGWSCTSLSLRTPASPTKRKTPLQTMLVPWMSAGTASWSGRKGLKWYRNCARGGLMAAKGNESSHVPPRDTSRRLSRMRGGRRCSPNELQQQGPYLRTSGQATSPNVICVIYGTKALVQRFSVLRPPLANLRPGNSPATFLPLIPYNFVLTTQDIEVTSSCVWDRYTQAVVQWLTARALPGALQNQEPL